eukprot:TRINITY_DN61818_c0_g1_i1.p1 TRINITY_DN61818_c0_g1~~TRINITY_DN61818_c0_g1_i1.p1  ORF type:complete len:171 (-),score=31.10 TRINITY_DN61818_c0_g1_i1:92-604(-)
MAALRPNDLVSPSFAEQSAKMCSQLQVDTRRQLESLAVRLASAEGRLTGITQVEAEVAAQRRQNQELAAQLLKLKSRARQVERSRKHTERRAQLAEEDVNQLLLDVGEIQTEVGVYKSQAATCARLDDEEEKLRQELQSCKLELKAARLASTAAAISNWSISPRKSGYAS